MRRERTLFALVMAATALLAPAAQAQTSGRLSAGAVVWTGDTDLVVTRATDYDGTSRTAQEASKEWNALGSGMGGRVAYEFPRLLSIYGEVGTVQTTIQSRDVAPLDRTSRGLDAGTFFGAGARLSDDVPGSRTMFWSAGVALRTQSADLETDPTHSWSYDETLVAMDGKLGTRLHQLSLYGGVRVVQQSADLDQTDLGNPPAQQTRTTELDRDGQVDFLMGMQTAVSNVAGFAELALIGTTSASAGVAFRF